MAVKEYKPLYTVREVSEVLGCNVNTVYELINNKNLPALKLGLLKVKGADLEDFINNFPTE